MSDQSPFPEKIPHHYKPQVSWSDSYTKAHQAIESLTAILPAISPSLSSSETPASCLLHNSDVATQISTLFRSPKSGAVNDNLCAWLYDTFHSSEPDLHLVVLRFIPVIASVYLSRAALNKPLAGFESVLLAIYGYETAARNGQAITLSIPDLSHSSIYHETKQMAKSGATELHLAVISPSLEPHGTVRSTRRARIVGVALELYYSKISEIPIGSKIEFCEFCKIWSGQEHNDNEGENCESEKNDGIRGGRLNLPWELLQPILKILGHCLMGPDHKNKELFEAAFCACKSLHARSLHDINPRAILATASLLKLGEMAAHHTISNNEIDYTEIAITNVISI
ncbi:hypothetical protein BUALT_Bualt06G0028300 [Buddleja alternifolia]|uniref:Hyccin n=1 Tax=Buddleja alternifolia TaxID=168488 RepID=A0AAV6XN09_9LAMI|nr:hypothetical protein BUALT_Bualt06G0028300 [Buddleja alternifolia]